MLLNKVFILGGIKFHKDLFNNLYNLYIYKFCNYLMIASIAWQFVGRTTERHLAFFTRPTNAARLHRLINDSKICLDGSVKLSTNRVHVQVIGNISTNLKYVDTCIIPLLNIPQRMYKESEDHCMPVQRWDKT